MNRDQEPDLPRPRRADESLVDYLRDALGIPEATAEEYEARRNETTTVFRLGNARDDGTERRGRSERNPKFDPSTWIIERPFEISELMRPAPRYEDEDQLGDGSGPAFPDGDPGDDSDGA